MPFPFSVPSDLFFIIVRITCSILYDTVSPPTINVNQKCDEQSNEAIIVRRIQRAAVPIRAHPNVTAVALATLVFIVVSVTTAHTAALDLSYTSWQPTATASPSIVSPGGKPKLSSVDWASQAESSVELQYVNSLIAHMTLQQEVGQMIMIEFQESQMDPGLAYEISHYDIGSVILYNYNVLGTAQMQQFTKAMQADADLPLRGHDVVPAAWCAVV